MIALAQGALHDALIEAETGLLLVEHPHFIVPQLLAVAITVEIERGELEAAAAHAAAGEAGAVTGGTRLWRRVPDRPRTVADRAGRRRRVACGICSGAASACRHSALRWPNHWQTFAAPGARVARRRRGRGAPGVRAARVDRPWVGAAGALGRSLRAAALATGEDGRLELLQEAVAVLERSSARLELAYALADLGAELCRCRRRREGRDAQRRAIELADQCGAIVLARAGAGGPAERTRTPRAGAADGPERAHRRGVANLPPSARRAHQS